MHKKKKNIWTPHIVFALQKFYDSFEEGYEAVADGSTWGLIYFSPNFTKAMLAFYGSTNISGVDGSDMEEAAIHVYMDNTSKCVCVCVCVSSLNEDF